MDKFRGRKGVVHWENGSRSEHNISEDYVRTVLKCGEAGYKYFEVNSYKYFYNADQDSKELRPNKFFKNFNGNIVCLLKW